MITRYKFRKCNNRIRAFTLIEMVLVMLIIGILFAIAIPSFLSTRERSQARICVSNLRSIQDAKERWAMENRKTEEALPAASDLLSYIKSFPPCPGGGGYQINTVGKNPTCSVGGDHKTD